jgi:hypothetical protein
LWAVQRVLLILCEFFLVDDFLHVSSHAPEEAGRGQDRRQCPDDEGYSLGHPSWLDTKVTRPSPGETERVLHQDGLAAVRAVAQHCAAHNVRLVIVTGAGSYGHVLAKRHNFKTQPVLDSLSGERARQGELRRLPPCQFLTARAALEVHRSVQGTDFHCKRYWLTGRQISHGRFTWLPRYGVGLGSGRRAALWRFPVSCLRRALVETMFAQSG